MNENVSSRRTGGSPVGRLLFAFISLGALTVAGCGHTAELSQSISVQEEITPQPVRVGDSTVSVQLSDKNVAPIAKAVVLVEAEMNHPGMAPSFKTATETAPGHYQARITFDMAGDWVLLLHITLASGEKIERQIDVRGVQPH